MSIDPNFEPPGPGGSPLSVYTSSLSIGNVGNSYFQYLNGNGGYPPYSWSVVAGTLPTGLSINSGGYISGIPTVAGTYTFTVEVEDIILSTATRELSIQIDNATSPVITTTYLPSGMIGNVYSETFSATGGTPPYVNWTVLSGTLPPGLSLSSGGVLSGTPTTAGTYVFIIEVEDSVAVTGQASFQMVIQSPAPVITNIALPSGVTGTAYSQIVDATGGTAPYITWTVTIGNLPTGLTLIPGPTSVTISGTPVETGVFNFTLEVTDTALSTDTQAFSITIGNGAFPLISTQTLPFAPVNVAYSETVSASGGALPYVWSVTGNLPTGLTLNPDTGVISGTPTIEGSYVFTIRVTDFNGNFNTKLFSISVGNNILPAIITDYLPNGTITSQYSAFVQGAGGQLPYSWGVVGSLPTGLTINSITGEISGLPTTAGIYVFDIILTDLNLDVDIQTFTIEIGDGTTPLILTTYLEDGIVDIPYSETLLAAGGTPSYIWTVDSGILPNGLLLSQSGVLSGIPLDIGLFNFTLKITDALGATDTQDYQLLITGIGFDSNCCFCVFTNQEVVFSTNGLSGALKASGGTVLSNSKWKAPSEEGVYIVKLIVEGVNGKILVKNTITVVKKLEVLNIPNNFLTGLLPGDGFLIETNYPAEEVIWETIGDCIPTVTPRGNIYVSSSPADKCFGAFDCIIRGKVIPTEGCENLINYVDVRIKVDPVYPTPDNCGPYISKWLRDGKKFRVIKTEFEGGCDETHLKNRVPVIMWTVNYEGLPYYETKEVECPSCYACILYCGCKKDEQPPVYSDGCHPIFRSANRLEDFWNLVYGEYKSFTLVDYDTGEVWQNVKFDADMTFDHRHRRTANTRTVKLVWRPCCSNYPEGGRCSKHGLMNYKSKKQSCQVEQECQPETNIYNDR